MTTVQFYPLDIIYKVLNDKPVIYLFGRAVDKQQVCVIDDSFESYFWVIPQKDYPSLIESILNLKVESKNGVASVTRVEETFKKYLGKDVKVLKVYTPLPWMVPVVSFEVKNLNGVLSLHEYDIPFVRRYLIDRNIIPLTLTEAEGIIVNQGIKVITLKADTVKNVSQDTNSELKILAFDIETYNPQGKSVLPDVHPIVMISFYGKDFKKVITWKRFDNELSYLEVLSSEAEMIARFKEIVEQFRPDILAGYFSDGFDFPYIIKRAEKYKISLDLGLDASEVKLKKEGNTSVQITGFVHLDICRFIQRALRQTLETDTFSLDEVAYELLGEKKLKVDLNRLAPAWDESSPELECFASYNLHDSRLTYHVVEKLFPNIEEFVKLIGLLLFDINGMSFSKLVEWFILKQAVEFNEIAPNVPSYNELRDRKNMRFKGAFVFQPKPGFYKDIVVYDFRSLYPSIIISHNLGPESVNCSCCKDNLVPIDDVKLWFCKNKKGFIPTILKNIVTRRLRVKEILKTTDDPSQKVLLKARSEALKLLSNSFYGYLGFFGARWYSAESARSTTAYARHYIKDVISKAEKAGFDVIYSDTDSVFLTLGNKSKEDSKAFAKNINDNLPELMELEFEGYYPSGIFVSAKLSDTGAKKKYALLDDKGGMKIRGFEVIRRNSSQIAKDVQQSVLNIILKEDDVDKAFNYVKNVISELRKKVIDVSDVVISTQLQKPISEYESIGPHVAVAKRMHDKGYDVRPGTFIRYVIVEGKGVFRDRARFPDEIAHNEYDSDYYINNQVMPAVERIFNVLGVDIKELLLNKEQSKLSSFFK